MYHQIVLIIYTKKNITLKKLMRIKDICKNHPSDHYMLTPGTIKQLVININGSTSKYKNKTHNIVMNESTVVK